MLILCKKKNLVTKVNKQYFLKGNLYELTLGIVNTINALTNI